MKSTIFIAGSLVSPSASLLDLGTKMYFSIWVDFMAY